jgi:hypothetical protein
MQLRFFLNQGKTMKPFLGFLLLAFAAMNPASALAAESEVPTDQSVRLLLELTGAEQISLQMMDSMIKEFEGTFPDVPGSFWEEFRSEIRPGEIADLIVPVYQRHLSQEDVDDLTAFFSSPAGRRFVSKQPAILNDSMQVGAEWGARIGERAIEKLKAGGHLK